MCSGNGDVTDLGLCLNGLIPVESNAAPYCQRCGDINGTAIVIGSPVFPSSRIDEGDHPGHWRGLDYQNATSLKCDVSNHYTLYEQ
jgi:hypothetical protein